MGRPLAPMTKSEMTILALLRVDPKRFRSLYPLLTSTKARLAALKIKKESNHGEIRTRAVNITLDIR